MITNQYQEELNTFFKNATKSLNIQQKGKGKKKASTLKNITPKALKASFESCSEDLTKLFSNMILASDFPDKLKVAD